MRTVTFADTALVDWLNESFVLAWYDTRPLDEREVEPGVEQPAYTAEEIAAYPDGGGGTNIRTLFVRPDGTLLHAIQGWWPAAAFREECERSQKLFATADAVQALEEARAGMDALQAEAAKLRSDHAAEFTKPIRESAIARRAAALDLRANGARQLRAECQQSGESLEDWLNTFRENNSGREFK